MSINETLRLVGDSIVFEDDDGIFVYSQKQRKVVHLKNLDNHVLGKLKEQGFFQDMPSAHLNLDVKKFNNLTLLLTRNCVLACRYCYADSGNSNEMMAVDIADLAVKHYLSTKPIRPKVTFLGGGEPTLNIPVIKHLIEKYKNKMRWVITTSGVLSEPFLKWLLKQKVSISFSLDGPPNVQNHLRPLKNGGPSAPIVENSIRTLREKGSQLSIRSTITSQTASKIDNLLAYFEKLGVKSLHLEALYNLGRATQPKSNLKQPDVNDWVAAVISALKWAGQKNKIVTVHALIHFFQPSPYSFCGPVCGNTMVVNHKGMLTACSEVVDEKTEGWDVFSIGKLGQFPKINEKKLAYLANRITANMTKCKKCFARYICRGGCAYRGLTETNDLYSPDPRHCEFVKTILPIIIKRMAFDGY